MLRKPEGRSGNALGYEAKDGVTEKEFEATISHHGKVRLLLYMLEMPWVAPGPPREPQRRTKTTGTEGRMTGRYPEGKVSRAMVDHIEAVGEFLARSKSGAFRCVLLPAFYHSMQASILVD